MWDIVSSALGQENKQVPGARLLQQEGVGAASQVGMDGGLHPAPMRAPLAGRSFQRRQLPLESGKTGQRWQRGWEGAVGFEDGEEVCHGHTRRGRGGAGGRPASRYAGGPRRTGSCSRGSGLHRFPVLLSGYGMVESGHRGHCRERGRRVGRVTRATAVACKSQLQRRAEAPRCEGQRQGPVNRRPCGHEQCGVRVLEG